MDKLVIDRRASENPYLHRDFHISTDLSLSYVGEHYGKEGVREYLQQYASAYYQPLVKHIADEGLAALEKYFIDIYAAEDACDALETEITKGTLRINVSWCPAVRHMKSKGHTPSQWQEEAVRSLYGTVARKAGLEFHFTSYDARSGAAEFRFRSSKELFR